MSDPETQTFVQSWFRYAHEDLSAARATSVAARIRCFHAQQAAEKALKGALTFLAIEAPRRHDLNYLSGLLPAAWATRQPATELEWLTRWALDQRYPGDAPDATESDAERALGLATTIVEGLRGCLVATGADQPGDAT